MPIIIETDNRYICESQFVPKIQRCLKRLHKNADRYYTWMESHHLTIRPASVTEARFYENAICISRRTFQASDAWLCSVLIHETAHFWQYRTGKFRPGRVAELEANEYQLQVLHMLGAARYEIDHLRRQDGTHSPS